MKSLLKKTFTVGMFFTVLFGSYFTIDAKIKNQTSNTLKNNHIPLCSKQIIETSNKKQPTKQLPEDNQVRAIKDWNFMVYMVNNNNLHKFGVKNFKQMTKVGSTKTINLLLQMDDLGTTDITRYYIEKNNPVTIDPSSYVGSTMSGTAENLFEFIKWGIKNYPARHQCLVLWNHGSGIKDPSMWGRVIMKCRDDFFALNPQTGLLELNRNAMTKIMEETEKERGIGFNDETEEYLTNQDLKDVLERASKELLKGKKFDLICMDACHMGMVEIGSQIVTAADYFTGSEEVEPGSGYDYEKVLAPFIDGTLTSEAFARHVVSVYEEIYKDNLADYTQSAVDLSQLADFEENINAVATTMINLLKGLPSFTKTIKDIRRSSKQTTVFFDVDYIDVHHFYLSLLQRSKHAKANLDKQLADDLALSLNSLSIKKNDITKAKSNSELLDELTSSLEAGINLLEAMIIENTSGSSLPHARGLSIYFPQKTPHKSYQKTVFAKITKWLTFLNEYQKRA